MPDHYTDDKVMSELCVSIHADNVKAGWWSDMVTGESTIQTRNRAEMLMLTVSELSEGSDGYRDDVRDDKLPQYPMLDVELADTAIRLFDQIGSLGPDESGTVIGGCYIRGGVIARQMRGETLNGALMLIVNQLSRAMEHNRKKRVTLFRHALWDALLLVFRFADLRGIDLFPVIQAKRDFNAFRPDHKIEARRGVDGKQY